MYQVILEDKAKKEIERLSSKVLPPVIGRLLALKNEPRPRQAKRLKGSENDWSLRIRNHRALYAIDDTNKIVTVYRVKHRKEVYR